MAAPGNFLQVWDLMKGSKHDCLFQFSFPMTVATVIGNISTSQLYDYSTPLDVETKHSKQKKMI